MERSVIECEHEIWNFTCFLETARFCLDFSRDSYYEQYYNVIIRYKVCITNENGSTGKLKAQYKYLPCNTT